MMHAKPYKKSQDFKKGVAYCISSALKNCLREKIHAPKQSKNELNQPVKFASYLKARLLYMARGKKMLFALYTHEVAVVCYTTISKILIKANAI